MLAVVAATLLAVLSQSGPGQARHRHLRAYPAARLRHGYVLRSFAAPPARLASPAPPAAAPQASDPVLREIVGESDLKGPPLDPGWRKELFVVSDSVLLSGKIALVKMLPDWKVVITGRPALMVGVAAQEVRQQPGPIGPVAVVALGYNSVWQRNRENFKIWAAKFDAEAETMLSALEARGARKVIWVMLREPTPAMLPTGGVNGGVAASQYGMYAWFFPYVNERLRALKARHPELALADWATAGRQPGVTYDAIHLNDRGATLMANVLRIAIGLDPLAPAPVAVAAAAPAPSPPPPAAPAPALAPPAPYDPSAPSYAFRDCAHCPEMVVLPASSFLMGSPDAEPGHDPSEAPQHRVTIPRPFAIAKLDVTFDDWQACVDGGGCKGNPKPDDETWGRGRRPAINVSWDDAVDYTTWLSQTTGQRYRLPTEAEWEYAARAGATGPYTTGATINETQANFQPNITGKGDSRDGEYRQKTVEAGSFAPNAWGLYDMQGNVWQWVQDNWREDYAGAPTDGSAAGGDPTMRAMRGGSWYSFLPDIRLACRHRDLPDYRSADVGFRVARSL